MNEAMPEDIIFYRHHSSKKATSMFEERIRCSQAGLVVFNQIPPTPYSRAYALVSEERFFSLQKECCNLLYSLEEGDKKIVGVTGTNGKTSVVHYLAQILAFQGICPLTVGTLGVQLLIKKGEIVTSERIEESELTTPSYPRLREIFFKYRHRFSIAIIEVSSHALEQCRLGDIKLDMALWTNFTQDHLDYHDTMEKYFAAKEKIFNYLKPGAKLILHQKEKNITARLKENNLSKIIFANDNVVTSFQGFIQKNVALAQKGAGVLGHGKVEDLKKLTVPHGRFNIIAQGDKTVVIDYAHTPDALKSLLELVRETFWNKKIHLLFGCGGERDQSKRPLMGKVAQKCADKIYLTSDNPRGEDGQKILNEIKSSLLPDTSLVEGLDRRKVLLTALRALPPEGVLVVAGKGHEDFQEIKGVRYPFNDTHIVEEFLINHA